MGVVVLPLLLMSYTLGYIFKDSGVPIPGIGYVDIWGFLVNNKPQAAKDLAFENYVIWILFYTIAHFLMYVKPQRSLFHPFKLNPNYPPYSLVLKEIFRSIRGMNRFCNKKITNKFLGDCFSNNFYPTDQR